jgi:hypothetical protein
MLVNMTVLADCCLRFVVQRDLAQDLCARIGTMNQSIGHCVCQSSSWFTVRATRQIENSKDCRRILMLFGCFLMLLHSIGNGIPRSRGMGVLERHAGGCILIELILLLSLFIICTLVRWRGRRKCIAEQIGQKGSFAYFGAVTTPSGH